MHDDPASPLSDAASELEPVLLPELAELRATHEMEWASGASHLLDTASMLVDFTGLPDNESIL